MAQIRKIGLSLVTVLILILFVIFTHSCTDEKEIPKEKGNAETVKVEKTEQNTEMNVGTVEELVESKPEEKESERQELLIVKSKESVKTSEVSEKPEQSENSKHTHNWIKQTETIPHKAEGHYEKVLVEDAWTEEVPIYEIREREICGNCGEDVTADPAGHIKEHMVNGTGMKGCKTEPRKIQVGTETVTHPAKYTEKWVEDKPAWTETITTYYCNCGATK